MTRFSRMNLPPLCVLVHRVLVHRVLVLRVLVHRVLVPRVLALWVAALLLAGSATPQTAQAQENAQKDTQQDTQQDSQKDTQKDSQQDAQQDSQQELDLESLHAPFELRKGDITASYKVFLGGFHVARLRFFISETHSAQGTAGGFHYRMSGQTAGWVGSLSKRGFLAVSEAEVRRKADTGTESGGESGTAVSDVFYWSQFRALDKDATGTKNSKAKNISELETSGKTGGFLAHESWRPRYFLRAPTGAITALGGASRWAGTRSDIPYGADDGAELSDTVDPLAFFARFFKATESGTEHSTNPSQQCQVNSKVYDGKYLYRITLDSAERKSLRLKKYTPYQGEFTLCHFSVEPLGGFRNEQKRKSFPTTAEFWLHDDLGGFSVPVLFKFRVRGNLFLGYLQEAQRIP